jgi:hypothetical protein
MATNQRYHDGNVNQSCHDGSLDQRYQDGKRSYHDQGLGYSGGSKSYQDGNPVLNHGQVVQDDVEDEEQKGSSSRMGRQLRKGRLVKEVSPVVTGRVSPLIVGDDN